MTSEPLQSALHQAGWAGQSTRGIVFLWSAIPLRLEDETEKQYAERSPRNKAWCENVKKKEMLDKKKADARETLNGKSWEKLPKPKLTKTQTSLHSRTIWTASTLYSINLLIDKGMFCKGFLRLKTRVYLEVAYMWLKLSSNCFITFPRSLRKVVILKQ